MSLESKYRLYRERSLSGLWIHYNCIKPLVDNLDPKLFRTSVAGYSENNTPIHEIRLGTGALKIVLWSQMHGDESTATKGIFDILNFLGKEYGSNTEVVNLLKACTLVFLPMLNPDGALAYTRENAMGIDLNRDAKTLQSKESQVLQRVATRENPDFAFNLHDQTSWYNVADTNTVATLSFLSPAADIDKNLTKSRKEAMRVIVSMYKSLETQLPNGIGRYNDTFCENCFGDSIQKMGFPTILVESGYYPDDEMRETTRKFHFIALMTALFDIAHGSLPEYAAYNDIPMNEKYYYDTRIDTIYHNSLLTSIAVRYKYQVKQNKLIKRIDPDETIIGVELEDKYFHEIIDGKGKDFRDFY